MVYTTVRVRVQPDQLQQFLTDFYLEMQLGLTGLPHRAWYVNGSTIVEKSFELVRGIASKGSVPVGLRPIPAWLRWSAEGDGIYGLDVVDGSEFRGAPYEDNTQGLVILKKYAESKGLSVR